MLLTHILVIFGLELTPKSYVLDSSYSAEVNAGFQGTQAGADASRGAELDWHRVQTDFSRIARRPYLHFDVPLSPATKVVYISVFGQDGRVNANGLQRYSDKSIRAARDAEHGFLWKEKNGTYHR